ncbi:MAG: flagellar hook-length control protein FliK [Lachnospiraceae bacterium]|nr:flagellar hook-length control protein FliK [Lachnospiraceae bacterium]
MVRSLCCKRFDLDGALRTDMAGDREKRRDWIIMQILNMLGKYDQNIPVVAQEQTAKTGTQPLTGSLSSLNAGNIFEGTIKEMNGNQVLLMLGNGESIAARIEGQMELALNQSMFFEVKSNTQAQIAIKPYLGGLGNNPTLMKALMQAGIGVTGEHLEMVKTMMEEQLPIDKQSLSQMARQLAAFPDANPSTLAQMNKLGIPVTEANLQQFANYKADASAIFGELQEVLEQIPGSLVQEGNTAQQIVENHSRVIEILLQDSANTSNTESAVNVTEDGKVIAKAATPEGVGESQKSTDDAAQQVQNAVKENASSSSQLSNLLGKGGLAALEKQLAGLGFEKNGILLDDGGKLNTKLTSEEFLKNLQELLKNGTPLEKNALEKLFSGKEYKTLLRDAVERQWTLNPRQVEAKSVEKLYDRLQDQMNRLEQFAKQSGMEQGGLQRAVTTVRGNIEFMNEINQIYNFVQIPLKMNGQNVNSELFVYTNKKNIRDPNGELSAFLHLDLDHLGSTDVSVKMKGTEVKTNFYMEDDVSYALILKHAEELAEQLEKKGYHCKIEVGNEKREVDFVDDFLKRDLPNTGKVYRYSFDARA